MTCVSKHSLPYLTRRNVLSLDALALFDNSTNSSLYMNMFFFSFFYRMRDTARKIEEKYFSNLATHVEFLPVEWRSKLTLDGGTLLTGSFAVPVAAVCKIVPRSFTPCSLHMPCLDFIIFLHITQVSFCFLQTLSTPSLQIKYEV